MSVRVVAFEAREKEKPGWLNDPVSRLQVPASPLAALMSVQEPASAGVSKFNCTMLAPESVAAPPRLSESEVERLARLEARMDQCMELAIVVSELKSALDQFKGGYRAAYALMALAGVVGGFIAKFMPWGAK